MLEYTLITGASTGIGKELAKEFAKNHHNLILIARNKSKLEELKKELSSHSVKIEVFPMDLSKKDAPEKIHQYIKQNQYSVQILINNAGFATNGFFLKNSLQTELEEIQVNITSLLELTHRIGNEMLKDSLNKPKYHYKILNVASIAGFQPGPYMSTYYATKAFVLNFSEGLYEEFKQKNILVSVLCPGATKTEFFERAKIDHAMIAKSPYMMSAEDVAKYTYKKLMKNQPIIIPGIMNKIGVFSTRLFPRSVLRKITKFINQQKGN
jgi:short-subunit dehydrogenase